MKENTYEFKKDRGICYTSNGAFFFFDLEDYEKISQRIWTCNHCGYFISKYRTHHNQVLLHRLIMDFPKGLDVDHINGNKWDNRKNNLRAVTHQKNGFNKHKDNLIGVYYEEDRNKWLSMIATKQNGTIRKRFATKEEAIKYRLQMELKYFGKDFAPQRHLFEKYNIK